MARKPKKPVEAPPLAIESKRKPIDPSLEAGTDIPNNPDTEILPEPPEPARFTDTIHTYFVAAENMDIGPELQLLLLWNHIWRSRGYHTLILSDAHAERHPRYAEYLAKVDTFPTINSRGYERACWLRWLALAQVGGGAMSDHDVFPRGHVPLGVESRLTIFERGVPCLATGTPAAIDLFITHIMAYPDGYSPDGKHFSDMLAVRDLPSLWTEPIVRQVGDTDWLKAPFVHFSHASTEKYRPRHKHVKTLLAQTE